MITTWIAVLFCACSVYSVRLPLDTKERPDEGIQVGFSDIPSSAKHGSLRYNMPHREKNVNHVDREKRALIGTIVGAAIAAGTSLIGTTTSALQSNTGYLVTVGIEMENYSKWLLYSPHVAIWYGQISMPPTVVKPRTKETMIAHKTGHLVTGTSGIVSWKFRKDGTAYKVIVMWSVPYNQDHYSNWLGLGIHRDIPSFNPTFNDMYYGNPSWFKRKSYYYSTPTLEYCVNAVCVSGSMGTTHKPKVLVRFIPEDEDNLAEGLQIDRNG